MKNYSTFKKVIFLVSVVLLLPIIFNACSGKYNSTVLTNLSSTAPLGSSNDVDSITSPTEKGRLLYANNCVGCHGNIEISSQKMATSEKIQQAILNQPPMKYLSFLTASEIDLISIALNGITTTPPPPNATSKVTNFKSTITNRYLLASNLQEIFIADQNLDSNDTAIDNIIFKMILQKPEAFEGNCNRNDTNCLVDDSRKIINCGTGGSADCTSQMLSRSTAHMIPASSPIRKGYMIRVCEDILAIDKAVQTALNKSELTLSSPINTGNVLLLMKFFYSDRMTDSAVANELLKISTEAQSKGLSSLEQWRFIMLPLCMSPMNDLI